MNEVSLDKIIQLVTQEVVNQLKKNGVTVNGPLPQAGKGIAISLTGNINGIQRRTERVNMSRYKTPVLTERHINRLCEMAGKVIIPFGTIVTPKARETAKRKQIIIEME